MVFEYVNFYIGSYNSYINSKNASYDKKYIIYTHKNVSTQKTDFQ